MSKRSLSRRDFIKEFGLAAGLAIPFMKSEVAMAQTTTAPTRVMIVPLQHGWGYDRNVDAFTGSETNFTLPRIWQAFNPIKNQCVFVDGVRTSYWGNAHDVSYSDILTCGVRYNEPGSSSLGGPFPLPRSPSIDWMIGNHHAKNVLRLSANYASWGASYHPLCFDSNIRNLPQFTNARDAYLAIIDPLRQQQQQSGTSVSNAGKTSLLAALGKDTNRLLARLSGPERSKMEGYLAALTALEGRILATGANVENIVLPPLPGLTLSFNDQINQYLEMIKISFQLDTHRVAVLGLGQGVNDWSWRDPSGATRVGNTFGNDFHHEVAHYDRAPDYLPDPTARAAYEGWVTWYSQKIVSFVNTLANTPDVDGRRLIDNTIIVLTGEVGNGVHDRRDVGTIVIGGGGGIRRGRWIRTAKVEPRNRQGVFLGSRDVSGNLHTDGVNYGLPYSRNHMADLWVSVARLAGLNINSFGIDVYNHQPIALA